MQINDKLAPDKLYLQSQNALEVIKIENEKYENLKADFQTNIIDASSLGSTATSLKNYAEDFCLVLDKAIEANEIDKADHEAIQKAIETVYADKVDIHEVLDGFDILGKIEEAKNKIQEIENRIDEINDMSWIEGLFNSWFGNDSIASLESEKSDWEKILEDFQNKEHRYDGIENDTANLLNESEELRELVWTALASIEASFIDGEYISNPEWKQAFGRIDLKNQNLEVYTYLCSKKNIDGSLKYSEDDIFSIIAYGYKHFETAMKQIEKMKEHSIDSAFNDIVNNIISEWEENSFERRSEKVYAKLTENQKKCVENLDLLPPEFSEKKACMKYAAIYLFADGYEPEFVCGVLGNIYHEGKTGLFEDSHYGRNQL